MNAGLSFLARRPPRTGWFLFGLAALAVMMPPSMLLNSEMELAAGPIFFGALAGVILGIGGRRPWRALLVVPALIVPLVLLELMPPLRVILADTRTLFSRAPRPDFLLPQSIDLLSNRMVGLLQAAWKGDVPALDWAISHLSALLAYLAALLLGIGLRRGTSPLPYCFPLLVTISAVGITVRAGTIHIFLAIFVVLILALLAGFAGRERLWEREGVGFSDLLRWDVAGFGGALLFAVIMLGLLTPSAARNRFTTWIWSGIRLPAGLARLDKPQGNAGDDGISPFTLGGYGPGQNLELGRSLEEGAQSQVALTVRAPGLDPKSLPYWRGRIFAEYNGRGWGTGGIRRVVSQPFVVDRIPEGLVVQEIKDQRAGQQLRYGLPDIVAVDVGGTMELSALSTTTWTGTETDYKVYSRPPAPLSFSGSEAVESQRLLENFVTLPSGLPQRVVDLAKQITRDAGPQTARAAAIESYLRRLKYSYQVTPLPPGGDAVDQFLFEMRTGYCTYYASAMAVMARAVGIPSRVVTGYATGSYDAATNTFVVHESDAHAWPELYIDGVGWTRWEPTPVRPVPARSTTAEQPRPPVPQFPTAPQRVASRSGWWLVVLILGVLVLLVVVGRLRRLSRPLSPAAVHAELYRWGRRVGIQPQSGDSIEEYAGRLGGALPAVRQPLERVARLLTARLYRHSPLDAGEERSLVSAWYTVRSLIERRHDRNV